MDFIIIIQARLTDFNKNIEEAAMDLGYNYTKVLYKITLPIILPSIIAGWLLAFTISLDDLVVASFTTGPGANTLPIVVFSKVRLGLSPEVNALSAIIMLIVILAVLKTVPVVLESQILTLLTRRELKIDCVDQM